MKKYFFFLLICTVLLTVTACGSKPASTAVSTESPKVSSGESSPAASTPKSDLPKLPDYIKEKGKLVIGVKTDFPPFGTIDASGKNIGYDIDFAKKLAEYAFGDANAVEFVAVTSANRFPLLDSKKIDLLIATLTVSEERKKVVDFTDNYYSTSSMLLVKKDSKIQNLEDLKDQTVVVIQGSSEAMAFEKLVPSAKLLQFDVLSKALSALKDGRGVALVRDETVLDEIVAKDTSLKIVGTPFSTVPWAGAVRKGDTEWLNWVNAAMTKATSEDLFYTWFKKWLPEANNIPEHMPRKK
jgi:polar amino acid transport system substrate-binding protein